MVAEQGTCEPQALARSIRLPTTIRVYLRGRMAGCVQAKETITFFRLDSLRLGFSTAIAVLICSQGEYV